MITWIRRKLKERRKRRDWWRQAATVQDLLNDQEAVIADLRRQIAEDDGVKRYVIPDNAASRDLVRQSQLQGGIRGIASYNGEDELRRLQADLAAERQMLLERQRIAGLEGFLSLTTDLPPVDDCNVPGPLPPTPDAFEAGGGSSGGGGASGDFSTGTCPDSSTSDGGTPDATCE